MSPKFVNYTLWRNSIDYLSWRIGRAYDRALLVLHLYLFYPGRTTSRFGSGQPSAAAGGDALSGDLPLAAGASAALQGRAGALVLAGAVRRHRAGVGGCLPVSILRVGWPAFGYADDEFGAGDQYLAGLDFFGEYRFYLDHLINTGLRMCRHCKFYEKS